MFGFGAKKKEAARLCEKGFECLENNPKQSLGFFEEAISNDKKCGKAYLGLGILSEFGYAGNQSSDDAINYYTEAVNYDCVLGSLYLARLYLKGGPENEDSFLESFDYAMNNNDETFESPIHYVLFKEMGEILESGKGCISGQEYADEMYGYYEEYKEGKKYVHASYKEDDWNEDY